MLVSIKIVYLHILLAPYTYKYRNCNIEKRSEITLRIIATDMDGTLLNEYGRVSSENAEAIRKAQAAGIEVVVVTGRPYTNAVLPLEKAGLSCPIISLNGAEWRDRQGEILKRIPLEKEICKKIQAVCEEEDVYFEYFTNNGVISKSPQDRFVQLMTKLNADKYPEIDLETLKEIVSQRSKERFKHENCQQVENLDPLYEDEKIVIYKMFVLSANPEQLERMKQQLKKESRLTITSSESGNIEFNHPDAQKGMTLKLYADSKGISMQDVMALGDNYNDLSMLQMVGRGVAMGNAVDDIKKVCRYETDSNVEHGVARAIEEMLSEL